MDPNRRNLRTMRAQLAAATRHGHSPAEIDRMRMELRLARIEADLIDLLGEMILTGPQADRLINIVLSRRSNTELAEDARRRGAQVRVLMAVLARQGVDEEDIQAALQRAAVADAEAALA